MPSRRSLENTRKQLLQAGLELFAEKGITVTLDNVTMIDACRAAGLKTAGSAYKIWENQEQFRRDLFGHLIERSTASFATIDEADAEMAEQDEPPTMRELIRTATVANQALNQHTYPRYVALWLAARADQGLGEQLDAVDGVWLVRLGAFFAGVLENFDLECVPPYTPELLATAASALVEGFTIRSRTTPELVPITVQRPTGPDGTMQAWNLYGCAVEALFASFTRPKGSGRGA